jgi:hypothetical protein
MSASSIFAGALKLRKALRNAEPVPALCRYCLTRMSAHGPTRTSGDVCYSAAVRGQADVWTAVADKRSFELVALVRMLDRFSVPFGWRLRIHGCVPWLAARWGRSPRLAFKRGRACPDECA